MAENKSKKANQEEKEVPVVERRSNEETRPKSEYGMFGNTKPHSTTDVDKHEALDTDERSKKA